VANFGSSQFNDMRLRLRGKARMNNMVQRHGAFKAGKVVSVNNDGTVEVRLKGRANTMTIPNTSSFPVNADDSVMVGQYEGDSQKFDLMGFGAYTGSDVAVP